MSRRARSPLSFTFPVLARNTAIRDGLIELRARLAPLGLAETEAGGVELVFAEVMNNIAEHAYAWRQDGEMLLSVRLTPEGLACAVTDEGTAMPDGALPRGAGVDPGTPVDQMPEGGFGWLIIHRIAEDIRYARAVGVNQLSFRIPLAPPLAATG